MLRYSFSVTLLLFCWVSFAQQLPQASPDSIRKPYQEPIDWRPSRIRFGVDIANLTNSLIDPDISSFEGMAEIDFGNWYFVAETGSKTILRGVDYAYKSVGDYWRVGADVNMIPSSPGRHVLSVGFRYGRSHFDEQLFDPTQGIRVNNANINASWIELTSGLRMKLWRQLYLGYQLRLRGFKSLSDESGDLQTYDIPGFGRNKKSGTSVTRGGFGFNYYVYWTIPFRDKKIPARKPF